MENKENKYTNRIVTYLDILGFKKMVEDSISQNDPSIITEIMDFFNKVSKRYVGLNHKISDTENHVVYNAHAKFFSDTIMRVCEIHSDNEDDLLSVLFYEMHNLRDIQVFLVEKGILIRGCMHYGKTYFDDNYIFGSSVNLAHEIGEKYAIMPRIVLSVDILLLVHKAIQSINHNFITIFIDKDIDNTFFINYIKSSVIIPANDNGINQGHYQFIQRHKELIVMNLNMYKDNPRILEKYIWLKDYHNRTIQKYTDHYNVPELLIN